MKVLPARTVKEVGDAAILMCDLVEANKALYSDDSETINSYYRGSWFFDNNPKIPEEYCPPHGDVLIAYLEDSPAGTVAISRMDEDHCELKSMFVSPGHRRKGVAVVLCDAVIGLARSQGYKVIRLTTGERQPEARNLYRQLGFIGVIPWDINPPDGYDYYELSLSSSVE